MICHYCGTDDDLRPYGPGGASVCFPCATETPEREAQARGAFAAQLSAAAAMSPIGVVLIDARAGGPEPLLPGDLEALR